MKCGLGANCTVQKNLEPSDTFDKDKSRKKNVLTLTSIGISLSLVSGSLYEHEASLLVYLQLGSSDHADVTVYQRV